MKKLFSHMFDTLPKRLVAGITIALAIALPMAASAAQTVKIDASSGVANVTAGDTSYSSSADASYNQIVKVEITYDNEEAAGSGKTANDLRVKIGIPNAAGESQTVTTSVGADNTNTVTGSVKVNLDRSDAYLEYIPGSAMWEHAVSAKSNKTTTQSISDAVVTSANGLVLGNENPCQAGSVAVLARVMVPGVSVTKQSEILGQSNQWSANNTAQPGDTMKYLITYENDGNTTENDVAIRDVLPKGMTIVPGTTEVYNTAYPNGTPESTNDVTTNGILIGSYLPGATAYVEFDAKLPVASALTCGSNTFQNVGIAQPEGMEAYYNYAVTMVSNQCTPKQPTYSC
ncbi:MAG TPA: hypothetical protein VMS08_02030, partial [Candidatus Saccharimonadia bacterium]|nr:hypothetical protein [Candidatus Saccharimonadia bacterium]